MEQLPIPLLKSIKQTIDNARIYLKEKNNGSPLHFRFREASETLKQILELQKYSDNPFWYTLYDGMIGRYIGLKYENRDLRNQLNDVKKDYEVLKEKYNQSIQQLEFKNTQNEKI